MTRPMSVNTSIIVRATAKGLPSGIIRSTIARRVARYTLNPSLENLFEKVSEGGLEHGDREIAPTYNDQPRNVVQLSAASWPNRPWPARRGSGEQSTAHGEPCSAFGFG